MNKRLPGKHQSAILKFFIVVFTACPALANEATFEMGQSEIIVSSGYFKLEWGAEDIETVFEVQQASQPDFSDAKLIYKGPDLASYISGLKNGIYYYRVRTREGDWSEIFTVSVEHQSMQLAIILFTIGFVVFGITAFIVIKGARETSKSSVS